MLIPSVIINQEPNVCEYLKSCIHSNFPQVSIQGEVSNYSQARELIKKETPSLIFIDPGSLDKHSASFHSKGGETRFEIICLSNRPEDAIIAIKNNVSGFILKPLKVRDVLTSVKIALKKISNRSFSSGILNTPYLPHRNLIGIPTMEGIDFIYVHEIIHCEGLLKCTKVVSTSKENMISSYGIGEFRKLLEEYGFFACHKSHLINLMHVKRFTREGFVFLSDNSAVPIARRKKSKFLDLLKHL